MKKQRESIFRKKWQKYISLKNIYNDFMMSWNQQEPHIISSLNELEWEVVWWTFFAGRPLEENESSSTKNTIQLPELYEVIHGKLESIFQIERWIGDLEDPEWERAEEMLLRRHIRSIWSPVTIRQWSFLLWPWVLPESDEDWEIYRHEWIEAAQFWSNPESIFHKVQVQRFIEKSQ